LPLWQPLLALVWQPTLINHEYIMLQFYLSLQLRVQLHAGQDSPWGLNLGWLGLGPQQHRSPPRSRTGLPDQRFHRKRL
jgi:hypothetical protein